MRRETIACREDGFWRVFRISRASDGKQLVSLYTRVINGEYQQLRDNLPISATTEGTKKLDYAIYLSPEEYRTVKSLFESGKLDEFSELVARLSLHDPHNLTDGVMVYHVKGTPVDSIHIVDNPEEVHVDLREF